MDEQKLLYVAMKLCNKPRKTKDDLIILLGATLLASHRMERCKRDEFIRKCGVGGNVLDDIHKNESLWINKAAELAKKR